jgi:protein-disulfide isomerase
MHYPLDTECNRFASSNLHPGACELALAADCAHQQQRFWEFRDAVFSADGIVTPEDIQHLATSAGLDLQRFNDCLHSEGAITSVGADIQLGNNIGVTVTPTLYFNGRPIVGALKPSLVTAAMDTIATHRN